MRKKRVERVEKYYTPVPPFRIHTAGKFIPLEEPLAKRNTPNAKDSYLIQSMKIMDTE